MKEERDDHGNNVNECICMHLVCVSQQPLKNIPIT